VFQLKKAIYGLKQATLQWWRALDRSMAEMGFRRLKSDSGIFALFGLNGIKVVVIVYVDDAIFLGPNIRDVNMAKDLFMKRWECCDLGTTKEFLRMLILRRGTTLILDQKEYLHTVLERFGMQNEKSVLTPLPSGYVPLNNTDPVTSLG
jgi:hypothetical protein